MKYTKEKFDNLLNALWQVLADIEEEIPLYLLSENGKRAKQAIAEAEK